MKYDIYLWFHWIADVDGVTTVFVGSNNWTDDEIYAVIPEAKAIARMQ